MPTATKKVRKSSALPKLASELESVKTSTLQQLYAELEAGALTIPQAVRMLRKTTGLTIPAYAEHVGISTRYLGDIERGLMNPTVDILEKVGEPFGLVVTFARRKQRP
jgi:DNA-binding transcriptional regulator YiaG